MTINAPPLSGSHSSSLVDSGLIKFAQQSSSEKVFRFETSNLGTRPGSNFTAEGPKLLLTINSSKSHKNAS